MRSIRRLAAAGAVAALALTAGAARADDLKIGFLATFTGPGGNLGVHSRDGFMLAVEQAGGKLGGVPTTVVLADDQLKPDVGRQEVDRLLEKENVQFVVGVVFSNVAMAVFKPITESGAFFISTNAGPSPIAGTQCSPNFFATSWQNDQTHAVVGKYANDKGYKRVLLLAPNYQAGKDGLNGFKQMYKGEVVDEIYTKLGEVDFAADIARIQSAKPDAVYAFMPGGPGIALIKQYHQAGLTKTIPLLSAFTIDDTSLTAVGEAGDGLVSASQWAADMDNAANVTFVDSFRKKYGYVPSYFAAQAYDAGLMIAAAVKATGGNLADKDKLRDALRHADFASVKGKWRLNTNHFPISDFFYVAPGKLADGAPAMVQGPLVIADYGDDFAKSCPMKW